MRRGSAVAVALAVALVAMPAARPRPADAAGNGTAVAVFYEARLDRPVSVDDVVTVARHRGLEVLSMRHAGRTTGEMIVGDAPLGLAAERYKATDLANFGTEPAVVSFVVGAPVPTGLPVGRSVVSDVEVRTTSSLDPAPDDDGVQAANIENPWAPDDGTVRAYNSSTGSPRQVRHRLLWKSRAGLNSYDDFAYEHDNKLDDPDAEIYVTPTGYPLCLSSHWVAPRGTTIVTSNMPSDAGVYADNARQDEDCGYYDISFGVFRPGKLATNTTYTVVVGAEAGPEPSSPMGLVAQKLSNDCEAFLPDGDYCIGLNQNRPGTDSEPLIGLHRQWRFPGCYTWVKGGTPTKGTCS